MTDIVLLHWPAEQSRLDEMRVKGTPRLVLVDVGQQPPPPTGDPCEDWVRLPADASDIHARIATLRLRAEDVAQDQPELDDNGVVRFGVATQTLPPLESRLMSALLDRYGAVVSRERLMTAGWPGTDPGRNALDVHMLRLRRRLTPLGLAVKTVRSRGYMLFASDSVQQAVS